MLRAYSVLRAGGAVALLGAVVFVLLGGVVPSRSAGAAITALDREGDELARKLREAEREFRARAANPPTPEPTMDPEVRRRTLGPTYNEAVRSDGPWPPPQWKEVPPPEDAPRELRDRTKYRWYLMPNEAGRLIVSFAPVGKPRLPAVRPDPRRKRLNRIAKQALIEPWQLSRLQREMPRLALLLVDRDLRGTSLGGCSSMIFSSVLHETRQSKYNSRFGVSLNTHVLADDEEGKDSLEAFVRFRLSQVKPVPVPATKDGKPIVGDGACWVTFPSSRQWWPRSKILEFHCGNVHVEMDVTDLGGELTEEQMVELIEELGRKICERVRYVRAWAEGKEERVELFGRQVQARRVGEEGVLVARLSELAAAAGLVFRYPEELVQKMRRELQSLAINPYYWTENRRIDGTSDLTLVTREGRELLFVGGYCEIRVGGKTIFTRFPNLRASDSTVITDMLVDVEGFKQALRAAS